MIAAHTVLHYANVKALHAALVFYLLRARHRNLQRNPKGPTRNVTAKDRLDLQSALEEVFQEIKFQSLAIDESVSHGFSPQLISEVVNNGENIFTTEDVLTNFPVFSVRNAIRILEVIQELFLDIPSLEDTLTLFDLGSTFDHVTWLTLEDMIFSDSDDDCQ